MARFAVIIEQDEDGVYCASCPALPGCFSNGDTYDDAVANMREAMALHIEVLTEHGDPVPVPRAVSIEDVDIDIAV
jgi:predicted RNase H-like HicB family nuclease